MTPAARYLALCGGVGGAKLALGLSKVLGPAQLTIVVNTGDDFEHAGLTICPDIDTVTYTLAGLAHREQGWGREAETWRALGEMERLGGPAWFRLGDLDLGLHLTRQAWLSEGLGLSETTRRIAAALGVAHAIAPMSDSPVRTMVDTDAGRMPFQHYFVRHRCAPAVRAVACEGAAQAQPAPAFADALDDPALAGVILCPSNPYLSLDPILSLSGVRDRLAALHAPVIAVAPLVAGTALKGPTAKIMAELGIAPSAASVALHYRQFLRGYVLADADADATRRQVGGGLPLLPGNIVMTDLGDKIALARRCLEFLSVLKEGR